ncbi:hypothetical protein [Streptomyces sp. NBC_00893]|uniref:hypothetical protein n=1 Tax=Streptomyces sp. NBC_00893 TaxID=2975862 RepID=UPI00225BE441|nr:hypothetical protein [Streptomyces sp. NBC_00893]MCX4848277.1 hypothetical protein [Streptomyces sp. NBC_00893]
MTHPTPTRLPDPATQADAPRTADLPLDVEAAAQAADDALRLRLGTTTRREIDTWTAELRGRISLFAEEVLDRPQTTATRTARREVDQLLASAPKDDVLVFSSYQHLCDLARMLRRLVDEHRARTGTALVGSVPEHLTGSAASGSGNGA